MPSPSYLLVCEITHNITIEILLLLKSFTKMLNILRGNPRCRLKRMWCRNLLHIVKLFKFYDKLKSKKKNKCKIKKT